MSVVPQKMIIMIANIYRPLLASFGSNAKASVEARKARIVGNQTRSFDHSQKTAMKPDLSPKASCTHAETPPPLGQPVASSAPAMLSGIRKVIVPIRYHPMDDQPNSAIGGRLRRLSTAATLIMASTNTPSALTLTFFLSIRTFLLFVKPSLRLLYPR